MGDIDNEQDLNLMLHDKTGALLMLNKDERKLIKELLLMTMNSGSVKDFIVKRLGDDYLQVGKKLLESMGGA
ncbi:MAG: hypothetical protein WAL98_22295 [Desulfatiglandaceae bacterium]|jgi:hypothetical protein